MKKNFINLAMAAMVAVGTVAYTGCGKKGCTNEADDKYDTAATESDPEACNPTGTVSKFVAQYQVTEGCGANTDTYNIGITASSTEYGIVVSNFYNVGSSVTGKVKQSTFTIDSQSLGATYTVSGSGSLSGSTITINYTISGGGNSVTCSATGNKL